MPLYKHSITGKYEQLPEDVAALYGEDVFTEVEKETVAEERERLRLEALADKVNLEFDDDDENEGDK